MTNWQGEKVGGREQGEECGSIRDILKRSVGESVNILGGGERNY